ncbi:two component transcriptional regulator, LuxR family [Geoalkalibacter ferrihydriticus]|uniref:LuxR family transcriptional regulator n=2 Tax=Geoalkalibacter ferrihydriticus TaxID=392333 RepID=A0A0C2HWQ4_9BACT|nr:response regulator transcription factor [Geoalkalibacter ferrihydriticus]KIH77217.1 LuxR family transcriptional regulator [Geoalkalibacter ferrihydriticus DSM 17813]SDM24922.1 two component transcriptional regulator, LuxR family [Geoalkalibacter ferrihydriticus]
MPIRILLADDHAVVREGLRTLLEAQGDMKVVGEAGNGREALNKAVLLNPNIILMDIAMPEVSGIDATRMILLQVPAAKILVLSTYHTTEYVSRAMQAGARAFIHKASAGFSVVNAVRAVMKGRLYFSDEIVAPKLKRTGSPVCPKTPLESLSRRERETLQLVVEGNTNATIAEKLNVSQKSVETYRSRLMVKLDIDNVPALVIFALQHGVISLP